MRVVSLRVIRHFSHFCVISSGAASGVTSACSARRGARRPARFALRHVTATQVGGGIASPAARDPGPWVTFVLKRTVAKVLSIELDVYVIDAAALVVSR